MKTDKNEKSIGKAAFVTGSASSIGRATALSFAHEGANVVVADVCKRANQETACLIEEQGGHSPSGAT